MGSRREAHWRRSPENWRIHICDIPGNWGIGGRTHYLTTSAARGKAHVQRQ
jgi:hypothetical protein